MTYRAIADELGWKNHATARHYSEALGYRDIQDRFADAFLFAGMTDDRAIAVECADSSRPLAVIGPDR